MGNLARAWVVLALGCGSAQAPTATTVESTASTTLLDAEPSDEAAEPILDVYVQGPGPSAGEIGTPDDFDAAIVATNTGDAPIVVRLAQIDFQLARANGEIVACEEPVEAAPAEAPEEVLPPRRAQTYRASFHCRVPKAGDYDVRAYLSFDARLDDRRDRRRYYAGSYRLHAR